MDELTFSRGEQSQAITLKYGGQEITFKKVPDTFAVRLKRGRATSEAVLKAALKEPKAPVTHVESDKPERLDVFRLEAGDPLDETMQELRDAPNADVITHVYTIDDATGAEVIPTGALTLQFKADTPKTRREEILDAHRLEVVREIDFLPDGLVVQLTSASTENPLKIAAKLQQLAEVLVAEPDLREPVSFEHVPSDELYPKQWHLKNRGDKVGFTAGADVKAEEAWDITRGSRQITICLIDDGFDLDHPDFNAPNKIVAPWDFAQNDPNPRPVAYDYNHGTPCAGVALAEENGTGVVGLAPGCAFMPVRFNRSLTDEVIESCFQYAIDHGADVISCSWSGPRPFYPLSTRKSAIIRKAATVGRRGKGCVILFAAGNQYAPLQGDSNHQGFALHPDVIAVAASTSRDKHFSYSNRGAEIAICAPSGALTGGTIVTTGRWGRSGYNPNGDYTESFGGTSSATPLAAALAALILSVNPELTAAEVKQIMMETADKIDPDTGQYVNDHSPLYGHGRINAYRAVQRARRAAKPTPPAPGEGSAAQAELYLQIVRVELALFAPAPNVATRVLEAKTIFAVSGDEAGAITGSRRAYRVEVRLINLESGQTDLVATTAGTLEPQIFRYLSQAQFAIPDIGRYELRSQVILSLPAGEISAEQALSTPLRVNP